MKFYQRTFIQLSFFVITGVSCHHKLIESVSAISIIDSSVAAYGGKNYEEMDVSFTFREYRVRLINEKGNFKYTRSFSDATGNKIYDVLVNDDFTRTVNDSLQNLPDEKKKSLASSLNSIAYFALLPYKLSEPAVVAEYIGDTSFLNNKYYKISIGFKAEGKQNEHQDEYCYWINKKNFQIDFISYKTGGPRMRKTIAQHNCGGILFQDYENYAMEDSAISVKDYDRFFLEGKMKLLSRIVNSDFTNNKVIH